MTAIKYNKELTSYYVILSHQMFQGFRFSIKKEQVENLTLQQQSNLVNQEAKRLLKEFFYQKNLYVLCEDYVNNLNVHLHSFLDDKVDNYACDHCHGLNHHYDNAINEVNSN